MTSLVFVHGLMGGSQQWQHQMEALSNFDCVALDLPGFGANAKAKALTSIPSFSSWALDELSARGVQRFNLIGHSMGGMVAQEMVAQAPERVDRLVLYGTGATGILPGRFETIETSKDRAKAEGSSVTARRIAATWFRAGEAATGFSRVAGIGARTSPQAALAGLDAMADWDGRNALGTLQMPTLVIWGERDRSYSWAQVEMLWKTLQNAQLAVMPGAAHAAHLEKPKLFHAILDDFLIPA